MGLNMHAGVNYPSSFKIFKMILSVNRCHGEIIAVKWFNEIIKFSSMVNNIIKTCATNIYNL
jgi:hypothetical protein